MREERRREIREIIRLSLLDIEAKESSFVIAKKLYFARQKNKNGNPHHAEQLYNRIINELYEDKGCDHAQLAISTLLLSSVLQCQGKIKQAREAFLRFFRSIKEFTYADVPHECTCSAKVLQAFALFEMKQGYPKKSYDLIQLAVKMDKDLSPILE